MQPFSLLFADFSAENIAWKEYAEDSKAFKEKYTYFSAGAQL